jgi:hypothetical protein
LLNGNSLARVAMANGGRSDACYQVLDNRNHCWLPGHGVGSRHRLNDLRTGIGVNSPAGRDVKSRRSERFGRPANPPKGHRAAAMKPASRCFVTAKVVRGCSGGRAARGSGRPGKRRRPVGLRRWWGRRSNIAGAGMWLACPRRSLNKTQVISTTCDAVFSKHDSMLMCSAAGLRKVMIMKKLIVLSVFMLTVFGSISGPAMAADIRSERGAPGWDGPQDPSPPWAPPG